jgi:hypothetical protein
VFICKLANQRRQTLPIHIFSVIQVRTSQKEYCCAPLLRVIHKFSNFVTYFMLVSKAKSPKIVCKAGQYDFSIHKKAVYFYVKCLLTFQTMVGLIHEYHGFSVLNVYYFTYFIVLTSIYSGTVLSIARISTGTRSTIE